MQLEEGDGGRERRGCVEGWEGERERKKKELVGIRCGADEDVRNCEKWTVQRRRIKKRRKKWQKDLVTVSLR